MDVSSNPVVTTLSAIVKKAPVPAAIFAIILFSAVVGPLLVGKDPNQIASSQTLQGITVEHPFGTDEFGRDVLSRMLQGGWVALSAVVVAVAFASLIGVPLGLLTAFYGGFLDFLVSRLFDGLQAFPVVLLAIALATVLGRSLQNALIAIGIVSIPTMMRVTRSVALETKEKEYVLAARAVGAGNSRILLKAVLPNCISPIIVQLSYVAPDAILYESSLGFLGVGAQPPVASWGVMLNTAKDYMFRAPSYAIIVGLILSLTIVSLNMCGDALREVIDPTLR